MDRERCLIALRDFFAARDGTAMAAACAALGGEAVPLDPDALEYAFNRLFVGPGKVVAPPYASVYLDPEHRLMGDVTQRVAAIYEAIGLACPRPGSLPDDHLALELDALLAFRALGTRAPDAGLAALRRYFLHEHMALWLPRFATAVRQAAEVPPAIARVIALLLACLDEELAETAPTAEQAASDQGRNVA